MIFKLDESDFRFPYNTDIASVYEQKMNLLLNIHEANLTKNIEHN